MDDIDRMVAVARGDMPADLVLCGGRIVNVFSGQIESADVAISGHGIAGIGTGYSGKKQIDLKGAFLAPGFIDAHVHIESSLCVPSQFAAAVLPHGVTTVVTDPHEIANVAGPAGVRFMAADARDTPLNVITMAPSCVPATNMATSGGEITYDDLRALFQQRVVHGLAEVMNYPAVINRKEPQRSFIYVTEDKPVDGHCPGLTGKALNAYAAGGVGSDHESITAEEAREKLARGLYLLVREATNARNLDALLPVITPANGRRVCFCTDDRTPCHLLKSGSVDEMVGRAIAAGIEPIEAIRMVTLNTAEWFGLHWLGAIAPGRMANMVVFDDLKRPQPRMVFSGGKLVARDGALVEAINATTQPHLGRCQVTWEKVSWEIAPRSNRFRVIGARPDQLVTDHRIVEGKPQADPSRDLLKMAVIERHGVRGSAGVGFIQSFGLRRGAIAGTVAHDHHNLVTIGADDDSMRTAAHAAANGGGLAVAVGENVIARLPLPIGGLMSNQPVARVAAEYDRLIVAAHELGSTLTDPFMAMSFMGLEVIPALKLTDLGLVDVEKFAIVDLFV